MDVIRSRVGDLVQHRIDAVGAAAGYDLGPRPDPALPARRPTAAPNARSAPGSAAPAPAADSFERTAPAATSPVYLRAQIARSERVQIDDPGALAPGRNPRREAVMAANDLRKVLAELSDLVGDPGATGADFDLKQMQVHAQRMLNRINFAEHTVAERPDEAAPDAGGDVSRAEAAPDADG